MNGVNVTDEIARDTYRAVMAAEPPDVLTPAEQYAFTALWSGTHITRRERRLVTLVCVSWAQDLQQMDEHAYAALASGDLTVQELLEWVLHFAIYCGWPKASTIESAILAAHDRLRAERGETVEDLPTLDPADAHLGLVDWDARLEAGRETFLEVNLIPAPDTNTYYRNSGIVGFVFGHLWRRPGLDHRERRFITLPCVMVEQAYVPMLNHVGSALQSGHLDRDQMGDVIATIARYGGTELAAQTQRFADDAWERIQDGRGWMSALRDHLAPEPATTDNP